MNTNALAKHYDSLTPKERFRLILAASGRGDEAERDRLANTGARITLSGPDYSPYAHAFNELALRTFIEMMAEAVYYSDAFAHVNVTRDDDDEAEEEQVDEAEGDEAEEEPDAKADAEPATDDGERPAWQRAFDMALAFGYTLRAKADGWKLFCERMNVPPFLLWEGLPGFDRLQRGVALAEKATFVPEGFLRWLNRVRPQEEPELAEVPLTAEGLADATAQLFRQRVEWWGG